jgi:transglutaminase-like putative cysteine protease
VDGALNQPPGRFARLAAVLLAALASLAQLRPARANDPAARLHEPIPPDPSEDLAMHVMLPGDLSPAIRTSRGRVGAPDPQELPSSAGPAYAATDQDRFRPDRDTRRPAVSAYDDPFTPSTAPFKRLSAFDAIREDFTLTVRDERQVPVPDGPPPGAEDDLFYGDLLVDVTAGQRVRIPSVGPGARLVHARLGIGAEDLPFRILRDGADNWFIQTGGRAPAAGSESVRRARLVMEIAIPRRALGGDFNDPAWPELPLVPPLPEAVAREAAIVRAAIGVSRKMRPREALNKLVQYFRSFADSDDPPRGRGSVYLDLALSKKGVCRHRAFAFLVTAQSLGIPTRMVINEAHAWVEVHDGWMFRRIDLGGAGRLEGGPTVDRATYEPLADAFKWPVGAKRGQDMIAEARASGSAGGSGGGSGTSGAGNGGGQARTASTGAATASLPSSASGGSTGTASESTSSVLVHVDVAESSPHRGDALHVHGTATAEGEPCDHATVELWLSDPTPSNDTAIRHPIMLGSLATDDHGVFEGALVLPGDMPLGDYDVIARSSGGGRCRNPDGR